MQARRRRVRLTGCISHANSALLTYAQKWHKSFIHIQYSHMLDVTSTRGSSSKCSKARTPRGLMLQITKAQLTWCCKIAAPGHPGTLMTLGCCQ